MTPVWAKAPLMLLLRHPKLFASLAFGVLLLTVAVASFPLFISSATSDLLDSAIRRATVTRYGAGITYRIDGQLIIPQEGGDPLPRPAEIGPMFARAIGSEPLLGKPIENVRGPRISISGRQDSSVPGRFFSGTDVLEHIDVLEGGEGPGVLLPDTTADTIGVGPGDMVRIGFETRSSVRTRVAGVYRALIFEAPSGYWSEWNDDIYSRCQGQDCPVPAQFVIVRDDELRRLAEVLRFPIMSYAWQAPIASGRALTIDDARGLLAFRTRLEETLSEDGTPAERAFRCCGAREVGAGAPTFYFGRVITTLRSDITLVLADAERRIATIEEPGRVLVFAGVAVSLAVIAGGGIFAMAARRVEAQLLFARGARTSTVAMSSAIEAALPCLVGVVVGLAVSFLLVRLLGPAGPVSSTEAIVAARNAAFAAIGSVALIGLVSAAVFMRHSERHRVRHAALLRLPWELGLVALSAYAWQKLQSGGAFVEDPVLGVQRPSIQLLAFPALSIAGIGGLAARAFGQLARRARTRGSRSSAIYLAVRRLAGFSRLPILLVAASTLTLGLGVHAAIVAGSIQTTIDAKARAFVGSDASGRVLPQITPPADFPLPATSVVRRPDAGTLGNGGLPFDLLAIDASTFARIAYWNDAFAGTPIEELTRALLEPTAGRLPVVISGSAGRDPDSIEIDGRAVLVHVVARTRAFPGMVSLRPLIVADRERLRVAFEDRDPSSNLSASTQIWVRGAPRRATAALQRLRFPAFPILTSQQVKDIPEFSAVIDTFAVMDAVAIGAALLVVIVILMYLNGRQRSQLVAIGFSLRMGMTPAGYRRSLVFELGAMLSFSFVAALVLGGISALLIVPLLDPLATIPPAPLFVMPIAAVTLAAAALLAVAWMGGHLTARRAERADLGEVMRVAE